MQQALNSTIMMVLDVCIDARSPEQPAREAMERTHRWALRSLAAKQAVDNGQALFAIVQGGIHPHLRTESAAFLTSHAFDGFAIGGLAVGESKEQRYETTGYTAEKLPANKPRYLMGVGTPLDLLEAVRSGMDMFDCIIPVMMAQQGYAYTFRGQIRVTKQIYRLSDEPLDASCACPVCRVHSRGYLQHLASMKHGARFLAIHNLHHFAQLMSRLRGAILAGTFENTYRELKAALAGTG
jgi:queuine tRNA-ribosyltransferase